jgi:hypothetical protein
VSERWFSIDELVVKIKEVFAAQGLPGLAGLILGLVDAEVCMRWLRGEHPPGCCCEAPRFVLYRRRARRFRSAVGTIRIQWQRLRCTRCNRSVVPLRHALGIAKWQSKTGELERVVAEVVSDQSYRRSSSHLNTIGAVPVPKTTAHRWVMQSVCDEIPKPEQPLGALAVDATMYKRQPDAPAGLDNQGTLKVALGITPEGRIVPLDAFGSQSWKDTAEALKKKLPNDPHVLLSDGERAIARALSELAGHTQQRCHVHMSRELGYTLWRDGVAQAERQPHQQKLAGILHIELPAEDLESVQPDDRAALDERIKKAEAEIDGLVELFEQKKYHKAAGYLREARDHLFGYVRLWLKTGIVLPRTTNFLERFMRELARRLKRMAHNWSERGALKIARILMRRLLTPEDWLNYWSKKLRLENNVSILIRSIHQIPLR